MYKFSSPTSCLGIKWIQSSREERSKSWSWYPAQRGDQGTRRQPEGPVGILSRQAGPWYCASCCHLCSVRSTFPTIVPIRNAQNTFSLIFIGATPLNWLYSLVLYICEWFLFTPRLCSWVTEAAECLPNVSFQAFFQEGSNWWAAEDWQNKTCGGMTMFACS